MLLLAPEDSGAHPLAIAKIQAGLACCCLIIQVMLLGLHQTSCSGSRVRTLRCSRHFCVRAQDTRAGYAESSKTVGPAKPLWSCCGSITVHAACAEVLNASILQENVQTPTSTQNPLQKCTPTLPRTSLSSLGSASFRACSQTRRGLSCSVRCTTTLASNLHSPLQDGPHLRLGLRHINLTQLTA